MTDPQTLYRLEMLVQCQSNCAFPPTEGAFKGSAWHGRLDASLRKSPLLYKLLLEPQPRRLLLDFPVDAGAQGQTLFNRTAYPKGALVPLSWVIAVPPNTNIDAIEQYLLQSTQRAGREQQHGFLGVFDLVSWQMQAFASAAKKAELRQTSDLALHFDTMLRLDDALPDTRSVPALATILTHLHRRVASYRLSEHSTYLAMLDEARQAIQTLQATPLAYQLHAVDAYRLSAAKRQRHPIGGWLGHISYRLPRAQLHPLLPLLTLGEWLRVGRKTNLGLGRFHYQLQPVIEPPIRFNPLQFFQAQPVPIFRLAAGAARASVPASSLTAPSP